MSKENVFFNRNADTKGKDLYPTPGWATRALFRNYKEIVGSIWEPACGRKHMSKVIKEEGYDNVTETDILYGQDFLKDDLNISADWIITNPPFNLGSEFVLRSLELAEVGVAFFVRYPFLETQKRYNAIWKDNPPTRIYQFSERVSLSPTEVLKKGESSAVVYVWVIWDKRDSTGDTKFKWIPPCKKLLELDEDYDDR